MKNILVMAGGTSTAWHIANIIKRYFNDSLFLIICDINESYLVHTSVLADKYIKVPPIKQENYYEVMLDLFKDNKIDIIVPLIDYDIMLFYRDNPDLQHIGVYSTAPNKKTSDQLGNKRNLHLFLNKLNINTPHILEKDELEDNVEYFVKDMVGFGSRGVKKEKGQFLKQISEKQIIQEIYTLPEITVDVVKNNNDIYTVCRERIETKLGVCTKAKVYYDPGIHDIIKRIDLETSLPVISCVQFMKNSFGDWGLIDFNLRSGGGTALSAAAGFQAVRAAINIWCGKDCIAELLPTLQEEKYVVRAYEEILTK